MSHAHVIEQLQDAVRTQPQAHPVGGGSKPALSRPGAAGSLPLNALAGILEYEPSEYTFTALAGTPVRDVQALLNAHGQYLPFDPPFAQANATLGGTIAAGVSGPGRFRFGGVRDFLLGVRLINGEGTLVYGGGKVVKNAAGFDVPKLMVGSLGQFGIMTEVTFKVFPRPESSATLVVPMPGLGVAVDALRKLAASPLDLTAADLLPPSTLLLQLSGLQQSLPARLARVQQFLGQTGELAQGPEEEKVWDDLKNCAWVPPRYALVKVPLTTGQIARMEQEIAAVAAPRHYSVGGKVAWLAWPDAVPIRQLEAILQRMGCSGLALTGQWDNPLLGVPKINAFQERLLSVFDPQGKFGRSSHAA